MPLGSGKSVVLGELGNEGLRERAVALGKLAEFRMKLEKGFEPGSVFLEKGLEGWEFRVGCPR
jgi:hypothetical protein